MPALKKTEFVGEVTFLGRVVDREAGLQSERLDQVELDWGGMAGEAHGGLTRKSCSRVASQYPKNTEIRNVRALSVVSHEELAVIAQKTGLDQLDPTLLGASLVISGIPDFTHILAKFLGLSLILWAFSLGACGQLLASVPQIGCFGWVVGIGRTSHRFVPVKIKRRLPG